MRLTLRTMLAWLDDVLDPADAEVLGQKIEANDFASKLVERIRGVITKLRLGAPKTIGVGIGRDANSVAEYLDSRLAEERVAEFEKTCLESDILLSETACCHQILSLVLHKPANVSTELRDRVYAMSTEAQATPPAAEQPTAEHSKGLNGALPAPEAPPQTAPAAKSPAKTSTAPTPKPAEVPDYMKSGSSSAFWPYVGVVALVFVLAFIALRAMGPFDDSHPLAVLVRPSASEEVASADSIEPEIETPELDFGGGGTEFDPTAGGTEFDPTVGIPGMTEVDPSAIGIGDGPKTAFDPIDDEPEVIGDPNNGPPEVVVIPEMPRDPVVTEEGPPGLGGDEPIVTEEGPPGSDPLATDGPPTPVDPAPAIDKPEPVVVDPKPGVPGPVVAAKKGGKVVGRSLPGQEVLAVYNPDSGQWFRLPNAGPVLSGRPLRVLPGFRPQITLDMGLRLTLLGGTDIQFVTLEDDTAPPVLKLSSGRVFMTAGKAGVTLPAVVADRAGFIDLPDADSRLAIEVERFRASGVASTAANILVKMKLIALSGRVIWRDDDREVTLKPGEAVSLASDAGFAEEGSVELPEWITSPEIVTIDRKASQQLEPEIDFERPLLVSLLEQVNHRRVEVRGLSVRSLAALSYYEPLLETFNSDEFRSFWNVHFDAIQDALARDEANADLLKKAVDKVHIDGAKDVYHMLVGFTQEQLETGGDATLVDYLDSERLDHRVLAFENLRRITDMTQLYRPESAASRRRTSVTRWRNLLEDDEIRYPVPEGVDAGL